MSAILCAPAKRLIQTRYGEFRMIAYESEVNGGESHIALVRGDLCPGCPAFHDGPAPGDVRDDARWQHSRPPCSHAVLVRVHTRCTAGDVFAADCHCREILDESMRMIAEEGLRRDCSTCTTPRAALRSIARPMSRSERIRAGRRGHSGLLRPETSGFTLILHQELRAREGSQARTGRILRAIGLGGQILSDLGIQRIRLLSNTPMHIPASGGLWTGDRGTGSDSSAGMQPRLGLHRTPDHLTSPGSFGAR